MKIAKRFSRENTFYRFEEFTRKKEEISKICEEEILDLGVGDPNTSPSKEIVYKIVEGLFDNDNHGYSDNGIKELVYALGNRLGVEYDKIALTMGIKSALVILGLMFIDEGDYLISLRPGYDVLGKMTRWLKGNVFYLDLKEENDFLPQLDEIPKTILKRTKLLYLNFPNNPTSSLANEKLYLKALELARKYDFYVVNDNAYGELVFNKEDEIYFRDVKGFYERGIELSSFSKTYSMSGYRLGYLISNSKVVEFFKKVKDNVDSGQFIPLQLGAIKALNDNDFLKENKEKYLRRVERVNKFLVSYGFKFKRPKAGFYFYVKIPHKIDGKVFKSAKEVSLYLLERYKIALIPYDDVGSYLRISLTFRANDLNEEEAYFLKLRERVEKMKIEI